MSPVLDNTHYDDEHIEATSRQLGRMTRHSKAEFHGESNETSPESDQGLVHELQRSEVRGESCI